MQYLEGASVQERKLNQFQNVFTRNDEIIEEMEIEALTYEQSFVGAWDKFIKKLTEKVD